MTSHGLEESLPSPCYVAEPFMALERERIFAREWLCVGREAEIPAPGDFKLVEIMGQSVLLVRNEAGVLRGFFNVCRHRGAQLCGAALPGAARQGGIIDRRRIRCPYHSWAYDLDGRLVAAPFLAAATGFEAAHFSLYPVGVESWGGFTFVNLTPADAPPLASALGSVPERLSRYPLASLATARTIRYEVAANWKVIAENYNECYHCGGVHPELCEIVPSFRRQGGAALDWERGIPHRDGAITFSRSGTTKLAPFPDLNEDERVRHKGEIVYPNLFVSLACDHVAAFILWPTAPDRTLIDCLFLFDAGAVTAPDFDAADTIEFWDLVNRQDWAICESVQRGMASRPHRHGYYAPMEDFTMDIRRYVERLVGVAATRQTPLEARGGVDER
jgi:Rieske 2Fe-2S family protein